MRKESPSPLTFQDWIERLKQAGMSVREREAGRVHISQYGCGAVLEVSPTGGPQFAVRPGLLLDDSVAHLLDRGYQKFWQNGQRLVPATSDQLKALHRFEQDLRGVMGLTTLYNEALGTVSARYVYDRVEGREGAKKHQPFD
ncbi:MAG: hypothetical protein HY647_08560 [Acidobacteria bacterium]|nr:hypothetical protein [Acidobacteriota bacterium]